MTEHNVVQLLEHMGRSYRRSYVPMNPTRVESIRALLVSELQTFSIPSFSAFFHLNVLRPVFAVLVLVVFGAGSLLKVASASLPGDALYTVKLVQERAQVRLTSDPSERAKLSVQFAVNRADEMRQVVEGHESTERKAERLTLAASGLEQHVATATDTLTSLSDKKALAAVVDEGTAQIASLLHNAKATATAEDGVVEEKVATALHAINETKALVELSTNPPTALATSVPTPNSGIAFPDAVIPLTQNIKKNPLPQSASLLNPAVSVYSLPVAQSIVSDGMLPLATSIGSAL